MKNINLGKTGFEVSEISLGCMRIGGVSEKDAAELIQTSLDEGVNFFDHADIYGAGKAEEVFSKAFQSLKISRDKIVLQSKCGIRNGSFDFSKEHILNATDGILKRLQTDYLDVLLLHRPDALMEPEEIAEAFETLHSNGKVKYFGVSNQNPMQMELLQKYLKKKIVANQLQFGVMHTGMIDCGLNVNMNIDPSVNRDGSVIDYCRLKDITIQAWSPLQYGFFDGPFVGNEKFPVLNKTLDAIAEMKGVTATAISIAWVLRHPAKIQVIAGTTSPKRLKEISSASRVELSRQEWYEIYLAAGNKLP